MNGNIFHSLWFIITALKYAKQLNCSFEVQTNVFSGVCDVCVADGAGLPLQWALDQNQKQWKEKWQPWHGHPAFLYNSLRPTWSCAGGDGICSLFSCLIHSAARNFVYHVTELWYGCCNATCPPGIKAHSPEISTVNWDLWLIWSSKPRSHTEQIMFQNMQQWEAFLRASGWFERKKSHICFEDDSRWRWCQLRLLWNEDCVSLPNHLGVRVQLTDFVFTFQRRG